MARKKMSAREAAIDVLEQEGRPLHVSEIAKRILANYTTGLKGATPEATIAAMLHTASNKGETFRKTKPGTFTLRARHVGEAKPDPKRRQPKASRQRRRVKAQERARVAA